MRATPATLNRRDVLVGGATLLSINVPTASAREASAALPASGAGTPFATDIRLPGLLHAVVARPPLRGCRLIEADTSEALRAGGVVGAILLDPGDDAPIPRLGGIAVLARDRWSALRGRDRLRPAWSEASGDTHCGPLCSDHFVPETAEPLTEPPSATADAGKRHCVIWACLSAPDRIRSALAALLALPPSTVRIHRTRLGGGPDRFANLAYALEAALLSRTIEAPVALGWTREDDIPFRRRRA